MLSGDGNENGKISKYIFINRSNKQKKKIQLCTCSTPFVKFLYRCFARLQKLPSHTFYGGNALCSCSLFCHCRSCSPWWPLVLPNSHRRHKVFIIFFQRNWTPLFFTLALALSFSVIHVYVDIKI